MRRMFLAVLLLLPLCLATSGFATDRPDALYQTTSAGVPVRVVSVSLADARVRVTPVVSRGFPGTDESFPSMIARTRPTIAINGSYFSMRTLRPIGDIMIDGRLVHQGLMGTALALSEDDAVIRRVRWGHAEDWSGFDTVLGCGPALVLGGRVDVRARQEGFRDPHVMGATARVGVGLTGDRRLLMVNTLAPVTFEQWGRVMRGLGCRDAMNLDAGSSTALYYRGQTVVPAGRRLTNLLCVYVDESRPRVTPPRPRIEVPERWRLPRLPRWPWK